MRPARKYVFLTNTGRAFVLLVFVTATSFLQTQETMFVWLKGEWTMQRRNGTLVESWEFTNDSTFKGTSYIISANGEKRVLEDLQLVRRNNQWSYISTVTNQNNNQPVRFVLTSFSNEGFVAENPSHDYPKRIRYSRIGSDSIHAVIDGGPDAPQKKSDYYYSRKK